MKLGLMRRLKAPWMSDREYQANVEGLNIVFGATLGFVLAGAEGLTTQAFLIVLTLTIGIVVTILYIRSSERRAFYAILALAGIAILPSTFAALAQSSILPDKLQPTLAAWALVMTIVEFSPRASRPAAGGGQPSGDRG